jgi:hypothetical protein
MTCHHRNLTLRVTVIYRQTTLFSLNFFSKDILINIFAFFTYDLDPE